jgi:thiol:disulfide interchange protein DsbD
MSSHDFDLVALQSGSGSEESNICELPKYADKLHYPHGLEGYFDYDQAIACAREQKKPLFIDFTGHGCVNCREMEARVWSDPRILKRLKEDFVMVALYVDDRTELPESEWYTSEYDGKVKKTIGRQNADYQIKQYNNNAQPYYVILDNDEQVVMNPRAYDLSIEGFTAFLEDAKTRFEKGESVK